jgi:hypothetical protein
MSCNKITKRVGFKNYEVYMISNVSPMRVCKKLMHECVVDHSDTRCYKSLSSLVLVWDLRQALGVDVILLQPTQPTLASVFQL